MHSILPVANSTALTTPSTHSSGDHVSILRRAASPIRLLTELFGRYARKISARALISPQGNTNPFSPSRTRSDLAPTYSLTATGHPHNMASFTTNPNASYSEGKTSKSEEQYTAGSCD